MQVRVLGPFEVARDQQSLTPSQPKLRQLFALLALSANSVVRSERLTEELWGPRPPAKATATLQTYVSHLRRLLAADGTAGQRCPTVLHTRHVAYALSVPDKAVDAHRFTELVERGRAELDHGQFEAGARTLRCALGIWRGAALSDVESGPVLSGHVARLEEARVAAIDQLVEVELTLGHHHEVIGELSALVREYPAHEGLHVKLMTALHQAGRRSEALHVFQRVRTTLVDDLGLEPGPQLRRVHRALLVGGSAADTGAAGRPTARTGPAVERPAQLPPDVPVFVGRRTEIAATQALVADADGSAPSVVSVVGPPGSGKSALCVHLAHVVRARFPHGQFYADLAELTCEDALVGFLRAIRGPAAPLPVSAEERVGLFRSWTAGRKVLVVLDNAVTTAGTARLLPSGGGCAAIVGCRSRLPLRGVGLSLELSRWSEDDGIELLASVLGWPRVRRELPAACQLFRLFEGMPLALVASASRLTVRPHWSLSMLVDRLGNERDWLEELANAEVDVLGSVELTCQSLPQGRRSAFYSLAASAAEPVTVDQAAALLETDSRQAESVLESLVEFQLLEVVGAGNGPSVAPFRYRVSPLIRVAAAALAPTAEQSGTDTTPHLRREPELGDEYVMDRVGVGSGTS